MTTGNSPPLQTQGYRPVASNVGHGTEGVKRLGTTHGPGDAIHACKGVVKLFSALLPTVTR